MTKIDLDYNNVPIIYEMNNEDFEAIEKDYEKNKIDFQKKDIQFLIKTTAGELKEHSSSIKGVFDFLVEAFENKLRNDGLTPLVFHSIYLTKLLYLCGDHNINDLILASLHDVLEDTSITETELRKKHFLENKNNLIEYLKTLSEDKNLSREPDGKNLPPRYIEHIKRIINAPREVINLEILDRFSDLMDLDYILKLPEKQRKLRLDSKIIKVRSFIENITRNRNDINKNCLNLFNYKVKRIEKLYKINVVIPIISK